MKTIVTGATGHLGTNVVRALVRSGRDVRALVRATSDRRLLEGLDVEIAVGDLLDPESLRRAMKGADVLYHAAAVYRLWAPDPATIVDPTVQGSRHVLEAAFDAGVEKVVFVSTMGTIGFTSDPNSLLDESASNKDPRTPYLRAKVQAEKEARAFGERTGLPIVFVNPGMIIGPHFTRPTPSIKLVLDFLLGAAPVYFDTGFSIVDAEDVAAGLLLAEEKGRPLERYLLGGDNQTMKALYETLAELTGLPRPRFKIPTPLAYLLANVAERAAHWTGKAPMLSRDTVRDFAGRYMFISSGKAKRELGYRYLEADEALRRTVEWLVTHEFVPKERRRQIALP